MRRAVAHIVGLSLSVALLIPSVASGGTNPPLYSGSVTIPACYKEVSGGVRIVTPWFPKDCDPTTVGYSAEDNTIPGQVCTSGGAFDCKSNEYFVSINTVGPQGPMGPKGDKGDKGDTGATGTTGAPGPKGDKGDQGIQEQGLKGDKGDQGPQGLQGIQGLKGDKGDPGTGGPTYSAGVGLELSSNQFRAKFPAVCDTPPFDPFECGSNVPHGPEYGTSNYVARADHSHPYPESVAGIKLSNYTKKNTVEFYPWDNGNWLVADPVAWCDPGDLLAGGGFHNGSAATVYVSKPVSFTPSNGPASYGWTAIGQERAPGPEESGVRTLTAYVACLKVEVTTVGGSVP